MLFSAPNGARTPSLSICWQDFGDLYAILVRASLTRRGSFVAGNKTQLGAAGSGFQSMPPDDVIFGSSPKMQLLRNCLAKVCPTDIPILIQGEPGTGKEVLGHW